ncbi:MAG: acetate kinase [Gemmatimonadales bacterium]|nr:MAG: acetate kinase [Gemmatimonadales bacterium]
MNILVLNAGSSTLKFELIRTDRERLAADADEKLARGVIERIGAEAILELDVTGGGHRVETAPLADIREAVEWLLRWIASAESGIDIDSLAEIHGVGHRVVHGGEDFRASVRIDDDVLSRLQDMIHLAPLHNPHNIRGIEAVRQVLGSGVPQAAVFDTAFHADLPEHAYLYAVPYSLYRRHRIRRYGFHGTSHRYVAWRYRKLLEVEKEDVRIITVHLGNGCSACAIDGGRSVDTSMGFTPLEGLVMGTRAGDLDPALLEYIAAREGMNVREVTNLLNKQSGLLGISGLTHDMRELLAEEAEHDDRRARLAIDLFCYRVRKYLGSYLAVLEGADAIVLTGGIGQNSAAIRQRILGPMGWAGLHLDEARNSDSADRGPRRVSTDDSPLAAWVIPTDEELLIARDTVRLIG